MKRIFVCAGMGLAKNEKINAEAFELGKMLSQDKSITFVQGGSTQGLMGLVLKGFLENSNNVEFLIPEAYYDYDAPALIELIGKDNFRATKTRGEAGRLEEITKCDEIIVLPGGTGTLEELLYANETKRSKEHDCKITLVNIDGFFDGLISQTNTNIAEGFSRTETIKYDVINSVYDFPRHREIAR